MFEQIHCKEHFEELTKHKDFKWVKKEFEQKKENWKSTYPKGRCEVIEARKDKKKEKKCGKKRYACVLLKFGCEEKPLYAVGVTR